MNDLFIKFLKGGSLASTAVYQVNEHKIVVKNVDLKNNREYGYYRWQSQVLLLIRLSKKWPELFPKILNYGVKKETAFYTIPYYEGWVNAYDYLRQDNVSTNQLGKLADNILREISKLHSQDYEVLQDAWTLYYEEEINRAINSIPEEILKYESVVYNGQEYPSYLMRKSKFYEIGVAIMSNISQAEVHGNLTLENILVSPSLDLIFIDPYFEVGISAPLGDYGQLLQSSNSAYEEVMEKYYKSQYNLEGGRELSLILEKNPNIEYVNNVFLNHINMMGRNAYFQARWLEVSQFIRMLPFKFAINHQVGNLIYIYSCYLIDNLVGEFDGI
jgi:hypothetical protein